MKELIKYQNGCLFIGSQPEGGGGSRKEFSYDGIELWLGSYGDAPKFACITLPATEERPRVEVIASKFYDELKALHKPFTPCDEATAERIRDLAFAAVGQLFGHGGRGGGVILGVIYDLYQAAKAEGVKDGRKQVAGQLQAILDEA